MRLRILCGLFVMPTLVVLAQQQPARPTATGNSAVDQAIQRMIQQDSSNRPPISKRLLAKDSHGPAVCSVPLLEMPIPKNADFTMKVIQPNAATAADNFESVPMPAPPCDRSTSEGRVATFPLEKR